MDGRTDAESPTQADARTRPESLNGEVGAVIAAQSRASLNSIYAGLGVQQDGILPQYTEPPKIFGREAKTALGLG